MEEALRQNDHKGGWEYEDEDWLLKRLDGELAELRCAIHKRKQEHKKRSSVEWPVVKIPLDREVGREAADVANFAMMIADVCGALKPVRQHIEETGI